MTHCLMKSVTPLVGQFVQAYCSGDRNIKTVCPLVHGDDDAISCDFLNLLRDAFCLVTGDQDS